MKVKKSFLPWKTTSYTVVKLTWTHSRNSNPLIMDVDKIDNVMVLNGAHSFEMIKDVGLVKDIAARYNTEDKMGTHAIGHTRFSTESIVDRYHAHPFQSYITPRYHRGSQWPDHQLLENKRPLRT